MTRYASGTARPRYTSAMRIKQYSSHNIDVSNARYNFCSRHSTSALAMIGAYNAFTSIRGFVSHRLNRRTVLCAYIAALSVNVAHSGKLIVFASINPTIIHTNVFRWRTSSHFSPSSSFINVSYSLVCAFHLCAPFFSFWNATAFLRFEKHFFLYFCQSVRVFPPYRWR